MQTLDLSQTGTRSEGRIKSLFWPTIATLEDVDYLGTQGLWVCVLVGLLTLAWSLLTGHPFMGLIVLSFFYLAGVGVREHSRSAASFVFIFYVVDSLAAGVGVARLGIAAVLFSNLRATWMAAKWSPESLASAPPRLAETWSDKFADQIPARLWPKARFVFYVLAVLLLALEILGLAFLYRRKI